MGTDGQLCWCDLWQPSGPVSAKCKYMYMYVYVYVFTLYHLYGCIDTHTQFQSIMASPGDKSEVAMMREELRQARQHLASWHESWKQAKQACEAWRKEADEANTRARVEREAGNKRLEEVGDWVEEEEGRGGRRHGRQ